MRLLLLSVTSAALICQPGNSATKDWPAYGHDGAGTRYSPLAQINCKNVSRLKVAWTFHTGDISTGTRRGARSGFETTPILVDGTLYLTTGFNRVIALDPVTGAQRWAFDPKIDLNLPYGDGLINRGAATWLDPRRAPAESCHRRIFEATLDARLIALDAATGRTCNDFGKAGVVSLRNVDRYEPGAYHMTSPPAVIDGLVIVGSAINDNDRVEMPSGVVRAYDARTGALRWSWNPLPPNGPHWRSGAANAWPPMAVDPGRHLVFVATGSASPDYYGGLRPGDDKWANSVVALRSQTGKLAWGFQLVHHDLWDYDTAAPPLLATVHREGQNIPVVIAGNKTGFLYVLNRDTGAPIFPIEERPVPQSNVPGEVTSPTQPFPVAPPSLLPHVAPDSVWGVTAADRETCRNWISGLQYKGIFTPPTIQGTLVAPGVVGGLNWSGSALDPQTNVLVANTTNLPLEAKLIPRASFEQARHSGPAGEYGDQAGAPYGMFRRFLLSPSHLPCNTPPWGVLTAVDINRGVILWQVPLGSMAGFSGSLATMAGVGHSPQLGVPPGSPSLGGSIATAGGLIFIGGTFDGEFRAFDIRTGKELWTVKLPASGNAVPMTYSVNGKQYVVIAAGGHAKIGEGKQSDALVAFALR